MSLLGFGIVEYSGLEIGKAGMGALANLVQLPILCNACPPALACLLSRSH